MTENLTQTEEEIALERIVRNQLAIKELEAENEQLKQFFKDRPEAYPAGSALERGKFYIKITKSTRIDDKLAREHLPWAKYTRVSKQVVDTTAARRILSDAELEKITKTYDNRIEIGLN